MYGKTQESGLTEIIPLIHTSAIRTRILFSHPESPQGSPWGVAAVWWLLDGRYSFLPEFPQGWPARHPGWLQSLMTMPSLSTDMAGTFPFLRINTSYWGIQLISPERWLGNQHSYSWREFFEHQFCAWQCKWLQRWIWHHYIPLAKQFSGGVRNKNNLLVGVEVMVKGMTD